MLLLAQVLEAFKENKFESVVIISYNSETDECKASWSGLATLPQLYYMRAMLDLEIDEARRTRLPHCTS